MLLRFCNEPPPFAELATALALTEAQSEPVKAIISAQRQRRHALAAPNREQHEQIRAATHDSLAAILSPEQMQKWHEFNASRRPPSPRDGGPEGQRAPPPPQ